MKLISPLFALVLIGCMPAMTAGAGTAFDQQAYAGATKADVWNAVMTSLAVNDLPVVGADFERGKIRARQHGYLDRRWAACPTVDRRSFDPLSPANLGVRSSPLYRGVDLRLEITETATGIRLALDPRFSDVGRDGGRRNFAFQFRCRSTGVLEQVLFSAAGASF